MAVRQRDEAFGGIVKRRALLVSSPSFCSKERAVKREIQYMGRRRLSARLLAARGDAHIGEKQPGAEARKFDAAQQA